MSEADMLPAGTEVMFPYEGATAVGIVKDSFMGLVDWNYLISYRCLLGTVTLVCRAEDVYAAVHKSQVEELNE